MNIKELNEKLNEYLEEEELPTGNLWHATYGIHLDDIKKEGLLLGKNKNWEQSKNRIYLATSKWSAESYCETAEDVSDEVYNSGIYVIEIDINKLDIDSLELDENNLGNYDGEVSTYEYSKNISPDCFLKIEKCL